MKNSIKEHDVVKHGEREGTVISIYHSKLFRGKTHNRAVCAVEFIENNISEIDDIPMDKLVKISPENS